MIERIETAYYRLPFQLMGDAGRGSQGTEELVIAKVHAEGAVGHGYAYTVGWGGHAIQALIEHDLAPLLVRQDPSQVQTLWETMWRQLLFVGRGGLASFAIAAVDIALWDLRGLLEGKPLYELLGASPSPNPIPVYGRGLDLGRPQEEVLRNVEGFLKEGLPGVEVKVGHPDPKPDEKLVGAVRKLIGDRIDLMIDANAAWTGYQALVHCQRLEAFNPLWFEEPTNPEDVSGHARLAGMLQAPIAVGESLHSAQEFRSYVAEQAVEMLQIDPVANGGITAALKALAMADQAGLPTTCHCADTLGAHLLCASQRPAYLERQPFELDRYLETPQPIVRGRVRPTETWGTGMRFNEKALEPHRG